MYIHVSIGIGFRGVDSRDFSLGLAQIPFSEFREIYFGRVATPSHGMSNRGGGGGGVE